MGFFDFLFGSQQSAPIEDATIQRQVAGLQRLTQALTQPGGVQQLAQQLAATGVDPASILQSPQTMSPVVRRPEPDIMPQPYLPGAMLDQAMGGQYPAIPQAPASPPAKKKETPSVFPLSAEQLATLQSLMPKPPQVKMPEVGRPSATQVSQMGQFAVPRIPHTSLYSILYGVK
jgi:hypothetical protein